MVEDRGEPSTCVGSGDPRRCISSRCYIIHKNKSGRENQRENAASRGGLEPLLREDYSADHSAAVAATSASTSSRNKVIHAACQPSDVNETRSKTGFFLFLYKEGNFDGRMQIDEVRTGRSRKIGKEGNKIFDG